MIISIYGWDSLEQGIGNLEHSKNYGENDHRITMYDK
jgi:hypothetical protein